MKAWLKELNDIPNNTQLADNVTSDAGLSDRSLCNTAYLCKAKNMNTSEMMDISIYHQLKQLTTAMVMIAVSLPVLAEDIENTQPILSMNGFGTLGAINHHQQDVKFRRDVSQAGGAEANDISFAQDSMLGIQLTAKLNQKLEASAQMLSRLNTDNNYDPQITWAFVKFKPTENSAIRMGRLGIEVYPQGDSAEIGYANLMIRQPIIIVPRTFDGLDAEITRTTSNGTIRLKGLAGWAKGHVIGSTEPYDMSGSKLMGAIAEYSQNGWTGRAAIADIHVQDDPAELLPGSAFLTNINATPNGADILKVLSMKDRTIKFSSLSLAYDEGKVQGIASYNMLESSNWSNQHLIYANMGYRIGKVTPFISWSMQHTDRNLIATGLPNLPQTAAFNQLALFVQTVQPIMINQTDITVGARYDFAENMALKFQIDHFRYKDSSSILDSRLLTESVENRSTKSLTLLSLALDFVF